MMRSGFLLLILFIGLSPVRALIFYGEDNSFNTVDPGTGLPFDQVARVETGGGSLLGSGVYLGNGWMLSADHVTRGRSSMQVRFDNGSSTTSTADISTVTQVRSGVDVSVFRLNSSPTGLSGVTLWDDDTKAFSGIHQLVGWGVGRDPADAVNTSPVTWGSDSTSAKRWGENEVDGAISPLNYSVGSTDYSNVTLVTQLDTDQDIETAATRFDSGSALFRDVSGTWTLMGIATAVETDGTSNFGDPADGNFFAFIGEYEQDIMVAIPEPSTLALASIALLLALSSGFRRRKALP